MHGKAPARRANGHKNGKITTTGRCRMFEENFTKENMKFTVIAFVAGIVVWLYTQNLVAGFVVAGITMWALTSKFWEQKKAVKK
jgi:hypothetical protein